MEEQDTSDLGDQGEQVLDPFIPGYREFGPTGESDYDVRQLAVVRARFLEPVYTYSSSTVTKFAYDVDSEHLHVWFQDKNSKLPKPEQHYVYLGVNKEVYFEMEFAPSKGKFVKDVLSGYSYIRIS